MKKLITHSLRSTDKCRSFCHRLLLKAKSYKLQADSRGFTLVEMMAATTLFVVVVLISVAALQSMVDANRKAQALHSVMNNLGITLDTMVRSIRMGSTYHCGGGIYTTVQDCAGGGVVLAFEPFGGDATDSGDQWVYLYDAATKRIYKSVEGGANSLAITSPTVTIDSMTFYVIGTDRGDGDTVQPKVVIEVKGTAGAEKIKTRTPFHIQATAVQRVLDL